MKDKIDLNLQGKAIRGKVELDGSKSISNRILLMQALSESSISIQHLSTSDDTRTFLELLNIGSGTLDAGAAGTTFRFLTAFFSFQKGEQILTGSARMKERPIGILVDQLRLLGAEIEYLEQEGYPPLRIGAATASGRNHLQIDAGVSSQYISALMMLGPTLPNGLYLELIGEIVSPSYLVLTMDLMETFGISLEFKDRSIIIPPSRYQYDGDFQVEADWSAASYYYSLAALAPEAEVELTGLQKDSLQGDSIISEIMEPFGIQTTFIDGGLIIKKVKDIQPSFFEFDFLSCPDIAQTLLAVCAAKGVPGKMKGLQTLAIKETDRVKAMSDELGPLGFNINPIDKGTIEFSGKADLLASPIFQTYHDHRMAMSLAPLACLGSISIENPGVVAKSYPGFWKDVLGVVRDA
jgi:3-phosphoshikimate 1-carboxyvinyltransferase